MAKRALCVGIDQYLMTTVPRLNGCVNDARATARLLEQRFGFEVKDLLDQRATRENYLRALGWLAQSSAPGDTAFVYHASYGAQLPDRSGDERAGLDEVFVLHDHNWQWNVFTDDDLAETLAKFPSGVSVICVFDTCHAAQGMAGARCVAPPMELPSVTWARGKNLQLRPRLRERPAHELANVLYLTACSPGEVALEVAGPQGIQGAFTQALHEALQATQGNASWQQIVGGVGQSLAARGVRQTPRGYGAPALLSQSILSAAAPQAAQAPSYGAPGAAPWSATSPHAMTYAAPSSQGYSNASMATTGYGPAPSAAAAAGAAGLAVAGNAYPVHQGQSAQLQELLPVTPIDTALNQFNDQDYTVRLCNAIFKVLPFSPPQVAYGTLVDAVKGLNVQPTHQFAQRVQEVASSEPVSKTLWVANAIDTGDAGIAVYSGVRSAMDLFFGDRKDVLETDPQQAVDAALKLLGISYIVFKLFPGSLPDRVKQFYALPAGQSLAIYYAAVEVALPFADNALVGTGHFLQNLHQKYGSQAANKLSSLIGSSDAQESQGLLSSIIAPMESVVQRVAPFAQKIADSASRHLPTAMNVADKVAGIVATGADALPVYRYLGARLAAEACVSQASRM